MAKILAADVASLYELGYASDPASPDTIRRLYFDAVAGKIYLVDAAFNILYTANGVAGGVNKVNIADLCAINDFGLNAKTSNPNAIYRLYYYQRAFGETTSGIILANQAFTILWYFEMVTAIAPLTAIAATDLCIQQDFGLNADPASPNTIWHCYFHEQQEQEGNLLYLVNGDFEIVASLTMT